LFKKLCVIVKFKLKYFWRKIKYPLLKFIITIITNLLALILFILLCAIYFLSFSEVIELIKELLTYLIYRFFNIISASFYFHFGHHWLFIEIIIFFSNIVDTIKTIGLFYTIFFFISFILILRRFYLYLKKKFSLLTNLLALIFFILLCAIYFLSFSVVIELIKQLLTYSIYRFFNIILAPFYFHFGHHWLFIEIIVIFSNIVDTIKTIGLFYTIFFFISFILILRRFYLYLFSLLKFIITIITNLLAWLLILIFFILVCVVCYNWIYFLSLLIKQLLTYLIYRFFNIILAPFYFYFGHDWLFIEIIVNTIETIGLFYTIFFFISFILILRRFYLYLKKKFRNNY